MNNPIFNKGLSPRKEGKPFLYFILPAVIIVGVVLVFPVIYGTGLSFFNWPQVDDGTRGFVGLNNYFDLFKDGEFWRSLALQLGFIIIAIPVELIIGFLVAILFNHEFPLSAFLRTLLLLPVFILPILSGLTWKLMLQPRYGALTYLLSLIGLEFPQGILSDQSLAYTAVIVQDIWRMWPFMFMILYAGISSLPGDIMEAAEIDGAGFFKKTFSITLPMLRGTIATAILLRTIDALRIFSEVFVMTKGGPGNGTMLFSLYIHKQAFEFGKLGYASAMAVLLIVISLLFAFGLVRKNMAIDTM
ncbi:MAG TPA: sugar ABC transporter permease [Thermotogota bacterium]|nr:sugar ABC transporter permease [Thermotogota bacterium]HPJ87561.1 sugar ABC transporter permease [Thermotogota bacterium]HPR94766.1 sugar ABC transporter permease [Thermotogota bacterium]